jgi:hypothetical protein
MAALDCTFTDPIVLTAGVLSSPSPSDSGAFAYSKMTCTEVGTPSAIMTEDFILGLSDFFHLTFIFYFLLLAIGAFFIGTWIYKR